MLCFVGFAVLSVSLLACAQVSPSASGDGGTGGMAGSASTGGTAGVGEGGSGGKAGAGGSGGEGGTGGVDPCAVVSPTGASDIEANELVVSLYLFDADNTQIAQSATSDTMEETISGSLEASPYFIEVQAFDTMGTDQPYTLEIAPVD